MGTIQTDKGYFSGANRCIHLWSEHGVTMVDMTWRRERPSEHQRLNASSRPTGMNTVFKMHCPSPWSLNVLEDPIHTVATFL